MIQIIFKLKIPNTHWNYYHGWSKSGITYNLYYLYTSDQHFLVVGTFENNVINNIIAIYIAVIHSVYISHYDITVLISNTFHNFFVINILQFFLLNIINFQLTTIRVYYIQFKIQYLYANCLLIIIIIIIFSLRLFT